MTGLPREPRIAVLVKRFPRLSETFVLSEFIELRRQGLDLVLFALMDPEEGVVQAAAEGIRGEVTYLRDSRRPARSWLRLLAGAARWSSGHPRGAMRVLRHVVVGERSWTGVRRALQGLWLAGELRRRGVTALHAHFAHSPAAVAHLAHLASGIPFSFTAHAKDLYTTPEQELRCRAEAARFVVTCTGFNGGHLRRTLDPLPVSVHVIHHGVDSERFCPAGRQPVPGRMLSVGRLVAKKGYESVLAAMAQLHAEGRALHWAVYGSGPLRAALEASAARLGVAHLVTFHGATVQEAVIAAYRTAAVFVLAPMVLENGDRDGIPNVIAEAMACGVPVVSTAVSGIPELIHDGVDGLLVEPGVPEALAGALARVLDDPELAAALGAAGRRTVEEHFDMVRSTAHLGRLLRAGAGVAEPPAARDCAA